MTFAVVKEYKKTNQMEGFTRPTRLVYKLYTTSVNAGAHHSLQDFVVVYILYILVNEPLSALWTIIVTYNYRILLYQVIF